MERIKAMAIAVAVSTFEAIRQDRSLRYALATFFLLAFALFGPLNQHITEALHHPALAAWMPDAICFHKSPTP